MADLDRLHARLEKLSQKIFHAKSKLKRQGEWHEGHARTSEELAARYADLKARVDENMPHDSAIDHHVTGLELSLREWLADLDDRTK